MASSDIGQTPLRTSSPELASPTTSTLPAGPSSSGTDQGVSPSTASAMTDTSQDSFSFWPVPPLNRAMDSIRTTVSDSIVTPLSPTPRLMGIGAFVDSPTISMPPTRSLASPATKDPPFWTERAAATRERPLWNERAAPFRNEPPPPPSGSYQVLNTSNTRSVPRSPVSPRHRPSPLALNAQMPETVDLTDPPPHTAMSTSSAYSTMSSELLDLSNLRRSIQQNLRDRPLGHGESDFELDSIDESERSMPSSPLDDGRSISPSAALLLFRVSPQFLVVDTRVYEDYTAGHIHRSANVSIPTLLLNRLRKQTTRAGVAGWVSLTRYVSTTSGQTLWNGVELSRWLDIVVIGVDDDDLDAPYTLADILEPLVTCGTVRVLNGGWAAIADRARQAGMVVADAPSHPSSVDVTTTASSPEALTPTGGVASRKNSLVVSPATAAPAPSQTNVPAISPVAPPNSEKNNVPSLTINTSSSFTPRRRPKLQLNMDKTSPPLAAPPPSQSVAQSGSQPGTSRPTGGSLSMLGGGLTKPPASISQRPNRPKLGGLTIDVGSSRIPNGPRSAVPLTGSCSPKTIPTLNVCPANSGARTSSLAPPLGEPWTASTSFTTPISGGSMFSNLPPPTPGASSRSSSISRAPAPPPIEISTILPSFLYLGPEIATKGDIEELQALGVRRILNCAIECDDDEGLGLREAFDKYYRIPMKDSVDESGVNKGIRDACKILDDARLHSSPVYVHCKAGKSRSVTVVLAYLIHANAWTLHTSYQYVAERRHGISPNIGFVAELMEFEAAELGHKQRMREDSESVQGHGEDEEAPIQHREPRLGPRYARESLPPEFGSDRLVDDESDGSADEEPLVAEHAPEANHRLRRKARPDIEVRKNGQWVLRKTPVDRVTLQPSRRVSKAGLESMMMRPLRRPDQA